MIASINAIVGAAGVSLLVQHVLAVALFPALITGAIFAAIFLGLFFVYQRRRISELVDASASLGSTRPADAQAVKSAAGMTLCACGLSAQSLPCR